jgi:hypothetical protein
MKRTIRSLFAACFAFLCLATLSASADDAPCAVMSFSAAVNVASIDFQTCKDVPKVKKGDKAVVTIGGAKIPSTVVDVVQGVFVTENLSILSPKLISLQPTSSSGTRNFEPADGPEYSGDAASVAFNDDAEIKLKLANPVSHSEHTSHVGQATADDSKNSASTGQANSNAFRFQYDGAYVVFPPRSASTKRWINRGLQQEYKLKIDTTDRKGTSFTDDNSASAGVFLPRVSAGALLNRARFGVQAAYNRALHSDDSNFDGKLLFEGWLPFFQAQTLLSKNSYAAPPLSFNVGWGYRDQNGASTRSHGTVFDGRLAYHLYLLEQYRIDFEQHTVVNQMNDRPSTTPKTQHSWKASVLMSPKPGGSFSAVMSFENGHAGPVFTKLRQYFVGIGFQRLFDTPPTPNGQP